MEKGHIPIRMCIACGAKASKNELARLALNHEGKVVRDGHGRMPGRGAYVCKNASCWSKLSGRNRLARAFGGRKGLAVPI